MAEVPNIYVSNGTCYSGHNVEADPAMIPCGNDYFGHAACCQASDTCLESSACFNGQYYVTYVAACTDPDYEHESCPNKFKDADAPWLGMSYCNDTSDEWVLCDQRDHPRTIVSPDPCACPTATGERTMTLAQFSHINNTASLPSATGLSIAFQPGYYPSRTASVDSTSSSTPSSSSVPITNSGSVTPTAFPAQPSAGLDTAATVGTAVGASVFALLLLASLGYFFLRRRRQKQKEVENASNDAKDPPQPDEACTTGTSAPASAPAPATNRNSSSNPADPSAIGVACGSSVADNHDMDTSQMSRSIWYSPHDSHISERENKAARPWSMVSELDGHGGAPRPMSMVVGSSSPGRMEAILEQQQGHDNAYGRYGYSQGQCQEQDEAGPSELPTNPIAELPG